QLEMVAFHKNKGSLERIREAKVIYHYQTLHANVLKNSLVLFLADTLSIVIQEEEENHGLFQYLEYAIYWLDTNKGINNFHILFLLHLTKYLGFYPDTSNTDLPYFDLLEGCFLSSPSLNPVLEGDSLKNFKQFLGINFDELFTVILNNNQRQELLKKLLLYFQLHLHGFRTPKSLAVLNAVFH
ncbi:MAG: DNA repair protein RecO C-terminal domain-containing protein, partial [Bacteroidota bacterium]